MVLKVIFYSVFIEINYGVAREKKSTSQGFLIL